MPTYFTEERDGWIRDELAKVATWPGVTQKKMMGCACFWAEGTMFATVANGCLVITKLSAEERAKVGGEPFFTGAGRPPIRKWVQVRVEEPADVRDEPPKAKVPRKP
jgi:TfoX/Sxy family transcriptional regulator of competence genes